MEILQIAIIAITASILAVTLKNERPEISMLISVVAGIMIFFVSSTYLRSVLNVINEITEKINVDLSFIEIILKIVSISYICEFSSQICKDAGEGAIASKVELAGKILILFTSAPVMLSLLELLTDII